LMNVKEQVAIVCKAVILRAERCHATVLENST
jgi:hypothetical protein